MTTTRLSPSMHCIGCGDGPFIRSAVPNGLCTGCAEDQAWAIRLSPERRAGISPAFGGPLLDIPSASDGEECEIELTDLGRLVGTHTSAVHRALDADDPSAVMVTHQALLLTGYAAH